MSGSRRAGFDRLYGELDLDSEAEGGAVEMRPIHALPVVLVAAALAGCGGWRRRQQHDERLVDAAGERRPSRRRRRPDERERRAPAKGPDGAKVFASAGCGGCHTLAAADASGEVGPNLDDLQPDARDGQKPGRERRRRDACVQRRPLARGDRRGRRPTSRTTPADRRRAQAAGAASAVSSAWYCASSARSSSCLGNRKKTSAAPSSDRRRSRRVGPLVAGDERRLRGRDDRVGVLRVLLRRCRRRARTTSSARSGPGR